MKHVDERGTVELLWRFCLYFIPDTFKYINHVCAIFLSRCRQYSPYSLHRSKTTQKPFRLSSHQRVYRILPLAGCAQTFQVCFSLGICLVLHTWHRQLQLTPIKGNPSLGPARNTWYLLLVYSVESMIAHFVILKCDVCNVFDAKTMHQGTACTSEVYSANVSRYGTLRNSLNFGNVKLFRERPT